MKRIVIISVMILSFIGTIFATNEHPNVNLNKCPQKITNSIQSEREMWDILEYFETTVSSQSGVVTDGNYIYTSSFSTELFRKFSMDGTFLEEFTIPGVSSCNCMTYDGTDFYGAKGQIENGIYVLDLENHVLRTTISVNASSIIGLGHLSYDPQLDNGNGGFWTGYWHELAALDMNGNEIIPNVWTGGASLGCGGTAYDNITDPENPSLLLFRQSGDSNLEISRFFINNQTFSGILHVATDIPGPSGGTTNAVASGLNSFINRNGKLVLLGIVDCFPGNDMVFEYEIANAFTYSNDICVKQLMNPTSGGNLTDHETVIVKISNNGTTAQSNFDIQYTLNDGTSTYGPFTKTVMQTIEPNEEIDISFDETADLSNPGIYSFEITSLLDGDENPANNVLTKTVSNTSESYGSASGGSSASQEYIANVSIAGISNDSGADYYADYSANPNLYIHLEQNMTYNLVITLANPYNADFAAVWVDWNHDYDFAPNERVFVSEMGQGPYSTDIVPDENAPLNTNLRMRIRLDYNNPDPSPYGTTSFGEVEDYTIIVAGQEFDPPTNLNVDEDNLLFTWNAPTDENVLSYNVFLYDAFVGNTGQTEWQFENLEIGQNYTAGVQAVYTDGTSEIITVNFCPNEVGINNDVLAKTKLITSYPNPFNPETNIYYSIQQNGFVNICVYNAKGQKIKTLVNTINKAGKHNVVWNGKDEQGRNVASGIYFYRMKTANYHKIKKMILIK